VKPFGLDAYHGGHATFTGDRHHDIELLKEVTISLRETSISTLKMVFSKHAIFSLLTAGSLIFSLEATAAQRRSLSDSECKGDVDTVRQVGVTKFENTPITIISQNANEVTFELSQEWTTTDNNLDHLFVRYKDTTFGAPTCLAFADMSATWNSQSLTAICTKNSKIALVEVWASDTNFGPADNATLPDCACNAPPDLPAAMVKYMFAVECVSTCAPTSCTIVEEDVTVEEDLPACIIDDSLNGVCGDYAIHANAAITFASGEDTRVVGNIGIYPTAETAITGMHIIKPGGSQIGQGSKAFADGVWGINGTYDQAMEPRANAIQLGTAAANEIGGRTFTPGTYYARTAINFVYGTVVTLDGEGDPDAKFLFQAGSTLITAADAYFVLVNGAKAKNVIWALGTSATLGARSIIEGSILAKASITFGTMAELRGCAIAKASVTFEDRGYVNVRKVTDVTRDAAGAATCASHDMDGVCSHFAVHARAAITFAATPNTATISNGDLAVSPGPINSAGNSITGNYDFVNGQTINKEDCLPFATTIMFNHADKRSPRSDETYWGHGIKEIGGHTFMPGAYRSGTAINLAAGTVTLNGDGNPDSVFLFQAGSTFITAADTSIVLINGAQAKNVIWALGTAATLGARSVVEGSILAGTAITVGTNARIHGCAIAMTAVTLDGEGYVDLP
jgi:hypothetical protein